MRGQSRFRATRDWPRTASEDSRAVYGRPKVRIGRLSGNLPAGKAAFMVAKRDSERLEGPFRAERKFESRGLQPPGPNLA